MATSAVMYPKVKLPTHIGVTILDPRARSVFKRLINLRKKVDFESVDLPALARRHQLGLAMIPPHAWIPVNDLKGYKKLLEALE